MIGDRIQVECPQCGKVSKTSIENAGKAGKCACGSRLTIPFPTEMPTADLAGFEASQRRQSWPVGLIGGAIAVAALASGATYLLTRPVGTPAAEGAQAAAPTPTPTETAAATTFYKHKPTCRFDMSEMPAITLSPRSLEESQRRAVLVFDLVTSLKEQPQTHDRGTVWLAMDLLLAGYLVNYGPEPTLDLRTLAMATNGANHLCRPRSPDVPIAVEWRLSPDRSFMSMTLQDSRACDDFVYLAIREWGRIRDHHFGPRVEVDGHMLLADCLIAFQRDASTMPPEVDGAFQVDGVDRQYDGWQYVATKTGRSGDYALTATLRDNYNQDTTDAWAEVMVEFTYDPR